MASASPSTLTAAPKPAPASAEPVRPPDAGERKQVTVLFADIRGATALIDALDPEAAMGLLDPAIAAMSEAVQRFGGTVNRVQGDGIMALFGAPVASEDHAVRACLAGQAILADTAARGTDVSIRVGIHSGEAVIRAVGNDPTDYDAVGVTAHLAHRLEQLAAPGSITLSGRTALLARGAVDLEYLGTPAIAGISETIEVYRLLRAHERAGWELRTASGAMTGFVGREGEVRQLENALSRAWLGRGQVVTISAEAGIGKSRLVHEFLRRLPAGGWKMISAAAMSHGEGTPYRLAADILRAWLGVQRGEDRAELARKLHLALTLLQLSAATEAAPLQSLLDLPVSDPGWALLSSNQQRDRLLPALRQVMLRETMMGPLLLVIEDLHWADPPSEQLLEQVIDGLGAARVLLLATTRPERRPSWVLQASRSYCTALHLNPLDEAASERLLGELLGTGAELAALRRRIVTQADGTPLFLEELSRALLDQGVVVRAQVEHHLRPANVALEAGDVVIPASVQAILATRIDRLAPEQRRLLQVASVIGKDVPHAILAAIAGLPTAAFERTLGELQSNEFLYEITRFGGRDYTFRHALTQAVTYDGMLRRQRRDLHARVLTVMDSLAADRAEELTEVLALHALRGELWERAVRLSLQAGHRANARSAWPQAIDFLEQGLSALAHLPDDATTWMLAIDLRLALRVAIGPLQGINRIVTLMDEASELARRLGDNTRRAQIEASRCMMLSILGQTSASISTGAVAYELASQIGDPSLLLNATFAFGQALWYSGALSRAAGVMGANLALVRGAWRLRSTGTTGTASVLLLVCYSKTLALLGRLEEARQLAAEAQAIADATGKPYDLCYSLVASGFLHLVTCDMPRAAADLEAAMAICRSGGVALLIPSVARYLGEPLAAIGRQSDALVILDDALVICAAHGSDVLTVWCGLARAAALPPDLALDQLDSTLALARSCAIRPALARGLHARGVLLQQSGRASEAHEAFAEAAAQAEQCDMVLERAAIARHTRKM